MFSAASRPLTRRLVLAFAAGALLASTTALAAPPANTLKAGFFGGRSDTAILGYDPVAYFTEGKPVKGQDKLVFTYLGAKWKFASQAHLDMFKADPEKYAPKYGGYCAYGVTQDALVSIEPDKFKIVDGKLYLNYNAEVQVKWATDIPGNIKAANGHWPKIVE